MNARCALGGVEIASPFEAVMRVAGALGEERAERVDVSGDPLGAQARRKTAIEEAGSRMKRPIEAMRVRPERLMFG